MRNAHLSPLSASCLHDVIHPLSGRQIGDQLPLLEHIGLKLRRPDLAAQSSFPHLELELRDPPSKRLGRFAFAPNNADLYRCRGAGSM
jgi:hypothetical protein